MSRHCPVCRVVIYGRSDKRYCSPTCRRDACRARTREVRIGDETYVGTEWSWPVERHLIPSLEREYGPHHRVVARARKYAAEIREEKYKELGRTMRRREID